MIRNSSSLLAALICVPLALWGTPAYAGTTTTTFQVSASARAACDIAATPMSFGEYVGDTATATSTITATCTTNSTYTIALDKGVGKGCTESLRCLTLEGGADLIEYSLYHNDTHTNVWTSANPHSGTGTGAPQAITVYGRARGAQDVIPGNYYDTITATISF